MSEIRQDRNDNGGSQHQNSCADSQSTAASASTSSSEMERMAAHEIQHIIKPNLQHWVRNSIRQGVGGDRASQQNDTSEDESMVSTLCKAMEVVLIQKVAPALGVVMENLMRKVVKGEIESQLEKSPSRNYGNEALSMKPRSLLLKFQNKLDLPVRTGIPIRGEGNASIKIVLNDATTGEVIKSGPEASAKVELVVLKGDIENDEGHKEFNQNIVREEKGNKSLLRGDVYLNLKEGIGTVGKIQFPHTSKHTKNCEFKLGARIVDNFDGTSVRNASTETFIIKDKREKYMEKAKIPSPSDPLWRLINISKRGPYYRRLVKENINTVRQLYSLSPERLRDITHMPDTKLKETLKHASNCYVEQCGGIFSDNFFLGNGSSDSSNIPCPSPPWLETPGSQTNGTSGMIDPHGNTQTCGSSFGAISSPDMSPRGYHNGDSHTINTQDDTPQYYSSLEGNHSDDRFEESDMLFARPPLSPPGQCPDSPISTWPDMDIMEHQQFPGNNFDIQYMDSGMISHVNPHRTRRWRRVFSALRFQKAMVLKSKLRKKSRHSYCGPQREE